MITQTTNEFPLDMRQPYNNGVNGCGEMIAGTLRNPITRRHKMFERTSADAVGGSQ